MERPGTVGLGAIVLAGGAARRLGGAVKPALRVGGVPLLARVLAAVGDADPIVVVGPPELAALVGPGVRVVRERPPGGGPAAGVAEGLRHLPVAPDGPELVALLAADLPFVTAATVAALARALDEGTGSTGAGGGSTGPPRAGRTVRTGPDAAADRADGAVLLDDAERPQWLCGVWRTEALRRGLDHLGDPPGRPLRQLFAGLRIVELRAGAPGEPPPWLDCDTDDDLRRAEEWTDVDTR